MKRRKIQATHPGQALASHTCQPPFLKGFLTDVPTPSVFLKDLVTVPWKPLGLCLPEVKGHNPSRATLLPRPQVSLTRALPHPSSRGRPHATELVRPGTHWGVQVPSGGGSSDATCPRHVGMSGTVQEKAEWGSTEGSFRRTPVLPSTFRLHSSVHLQLYSAIQKRSVPVKASVSGNGTKRRSNYR